MENVMFTANLKKYIYNSYNALDRYETFNGNPDRHWTTYSVPYEKQPHNNYESVSSKMRANYYKLRTKRRMKLYSFS